jgi:hypothetical protein
MNKKKESPYNKPGSHQQAPPDRNHGNGKKGEGGHAQAKDEKGLYKQLCYLARHGLPPGTSKNGYVRVISTIFQTLPDWWRCT